VKLLEGEAAAARGGAHPRLDSRSIRHCHSPRAAGGRRCRPAGRHRRLGSWEWLRVAGAATRHPVSVRRASGNFGSHFFRPPQPQQPAPLSVPGSAAVVGSAVRRSRCRGPRVPARRRPPPARLESV